MYVPNKDCWCYRYWTEYVFSEVYGIDEMSDFIGHLAAILDMKLNFLPFPAKCPLALC